MSATQDLFQQAQLAEAAYANFWDSSLNTLVNNTEDVRAALIASEFSSDQASAFVEEWEVIDHVPDTTTGFSATVFRNRQTQEYTLAIRGTQPGTLADLLNDINIISGNGVAAAQLVDLYNFVI